MNFLPFWDDPWAIGDRDPLWNVYCTHCEPWWGVGLDNAIRPIANRDVDRLNRPNRLERDEVEEAPIHSLGGTGAIRPHIVEEEGGLKKVQYKFGVRRIKPEDIKLSVREGRLVIEAKRIREGDDSRTVMEFHRMVTLPEGVKLEKLKSIVRPDGVLVVEAPFCPKGIQKEEQLQEIPIMHEGRLKDVDVEKETGMLEKPDVELQGKQVERDVVPEGLSSKAA